MLKSEHYLKFQIRIWMNTDMPVQVDGEPWMQLAGQVVVCRSALQVRSKVIAFFLVYRMMLQNLNRNHYVLKKIEKI